jgi:leader peptidase (prepilin peptidase)/N-methyltransferase
MIRILATVFAGLLGLAFGSFLNVCLSRWPEGESVVQPRSHCRNCDHVLAWWENVPLLSWLALRGRCRGCGIAISWRYPLVELAIGVLWATVACKFPSNVFDPSHSQVALYDSLFTAIAWMIFYWLLVALAILDAEHLWLPNKLTLPGIAAGFLFSALSFVSAVALDRITASQPHNFQYPHGIEWEIAWSRLLAITICAGLVLLIRWLYQLIRHREGMGLGDAKLMALLGAWLGLPGALLAFVIGALIGTAVALVLLASRRHAETWAAVQLPFGTFLCIGGIVSALWGQPILAAYLRWSGL